jgi:hypothetical protein
MSAFPLETPKSYFVGTGQGQIEFVPALKTQK